MTQLPFSLAKGYRQFRINNFAMNPRLYGQLAEGGQKPEVMIVACCDSRVPPEVIFNAEPGELFVVRNVANLVPPYETGGTYHGVSAALEFAMLGLKVPHVIVMGHSGCGGVGAYLEENYVEDAAGQFIRNWMGLLGESRAEVLERLAGHSRTEIRTALEQTAVRASLANLRTFPCVQALEAKGRVSLHGAYFDIASGGLSLLDPGSGNFEIV